jgi:hypothetical protein
MTGSCDRPGPPIEAPNPGNMANPLGSAGEYPGCESGSSTSALATRDPKTGHASKSSEADAYPMVGNIGFPILYGAEWARRGRRVAVDGWRWRSGTPERLRALGGLKDGGYRCAC